MNRRMEFSLLDNCILYVVCPPTIINTTQRGVGFCCRSSKKTKKNNQNSNWIMRIMYCDKWNNMRTTKTRTTSMKSILFDCQPMAHDFLSFFADFALKIRKKDFLWNVPFSCRISTTKKGQWIPALIAHQTILRYLVRDRRRYLGDALARSFVRQFLCFSCNQPAAGTAVVRLQENWVKMAKAEIIRTHRPLFR